MNPWSRSFWNEPFHNKIIIRLDNTADAKTTGRNQATLNNSAVPPATKPVPEKRYKSNHILLVFLSEMIFENAQEPFGRVIPGLSSNHLAQCPP